MNQPQYPQQQPPEYQVSYPPSQVPPSAGHYQSAGQQQSYPQPGGYPQPPQPERKSPLPLIIAGGLVVALAIGITLFLVLRDPGKDVAGGGEPGKPTAEEVTKAFFVAVDGKDQSGMEKTARGDVADDISDIVDGMAEATGVKFAEGKADPAATKTIGKVTIAVVHWKMDSAPSSAGGGLSVGLLDEGDGYQVCAISDIDDESASTKLTSFEDDWESSCDYNK